jgi:hypothetical protein
MPPRRVFAYSYRPEDYLSLAGATREGCVMSEAKSIEQVTDAYSRYMALTNDPRAAAVLALAEINNERGKDLASALCCICDRIEDMGGAL